MITTIGKHEVIFNPACCIGEKTITLTADFQPNHILRNKGFKASCGPSAAQDNLPHMAHIKKPRRRAAVQMLFHHTERILHRHIIARKRNHFGSKLKMHVIERRLP